jgi:galactokinase
MELEKLKERFEEIYGAGGARIFVGPGRVNLIGEHTDYNGGYVLPCAIDMRSACAVRRRDDGVINLASTSYPKAVSARTGDIESYKTLEWGSYQLGAACVLMKQGYEVTGCDMLFDETMPHSSGLSSSSAIAVATALALATLDSERTGRSIDMVSLALIAQKAENEYVGMNCGIMDQFASAMGKKGHAVLLRCSDLDYSYTSFEPERCGYSLVIANTAKPRALIESKYNERRAQCESALADIKRVLPGITCLADLSIKTFEGYKDAIRDETELMRAKHVVYENARTKQAAELLKNGMFFEFGRLMFASHESLRDAYEVTGKELDALVDAAMEAEGVLGSRMTGAGFGGCTVSLVESARTEEFMERAGRKYTEKTGLIPEFYISRAADGAREERL